MRRTSSTRHGGSGCSRACSWSSLCWRSTCSATAFGTRSTPGRAGDQPTSNGGLMRGKGLIAAIAVAGVTVGLAACGGGGGSGGNSSNASGTVAKGGTYRMATQDFGFTGAFDPSAEYLGWAFDLYGNLLVRTLLSFNHTAGAPGNVLVPDLA